MTCSFRKILEFLHNDFHFDALLQFIPFRQLGLPMACGSTEEHNADKRTI